MSETEINEFILKAVIGEDPVFVEHKKVSEAQKSPKINYDEKSATSSSPVTIADMPLEILEKIVGDSDLEDRLVLRKVSSNLLKLVDSKDIHCNIIHFNFGDYFSKIDFGNFHLNYTEPYEGGCDVNSTRKSYKDNRHYLNVMIADISTVLKNPKLEIDEMKFEDGRWGVKNYDTYSALSTFFNSLEFQLDVRSICIQTKDDRILPIIRFLKPTNLEEIKISAEYSTVEQFDKIAEMEQWKKAKKFSCHHFPNGFRFEKLSHFKELEINGFEFHGLNLIMVRDHLLKSADLESCNLSMKFPFWGRGDSEMMEETILEIMCEIPAFDSRTRRVLIQNSPDYFQLEYGRSSRRVYSLKITRVLGN